MSNSIKRILLNLLSLDNTDQDLNLSQTTTKKAEIIQKYQEIYKINPAYITNEYWTSAGRFHLKSLQTLLGDSSADWYKNKIHLVGITPLPEQLPLIKIYCGVLKPISYGEVTTLEGLINFEVISLSKEDDSLGENIAKRIQSLLNNGVPQSLCLPNGVIKIDVIKPSLRSDSDNTKIDCKIITQFLEI